MQNKIKQINNKKKKLTGKCLSSLGLLFQQVEACVLGAVDTVGSVFHQIREFLLRVLFMAHSTSVITRFYWTLTHCVFTNSQKYRQIMSRWLSGVQFKWPHDVLMWDSGFICEPFLGPLPLQTRNLQGLLGNLCSNVLPSKTNGYRRGP